MKASNIRRIPLIIFLFGMISFYAQEKKDKELLVGKWKSIDDPHSVIEFTKDRKCYINYVSAEDDVNVRDIYTYTFSQDKSENGTLFTGITLVDIKDSNYIINYTISFSIDGKILQLEYAYPTVGTDFYERIDSRVKTKESKPKPSSELEEESEPLLHWGFKLSDYDRGYFDGGVAYQQCKEEQDKEDRDIFDRHRLMPIEGMEWESKAPKLGLGDCREEAFERIKMSTKEYQDGFEKGWRDASMPLNKEKETTKKK